MTNWFTGANCDTALKTGADKKDKVYRASQSLCKFISLRMQPVAPIMYTCFPRLLSSLLLLLSSLRHPCRGMRNGVNRTSLSSPNYIGIENELLSVACYFFFFSHSPRTICTFLQRPTILNDFTPIFLLGARLTTRVRRSVSVDGTALIVIEVRGKAIPRAGGRSETASFSSWRGEGINVRQTYKAQGDSGALLVRWTEAAVFRRNEHEPR